MASWYQYLLVLLMALWSSEFYAQKSLDGKISALYEKYKEEGEPLHSAECDFLQRITEQDLSGSPDSVVFQYHYLFSEMAAGHEDLQGRFSHAEKALQILETKLMVPRVYNYSLQYVEVCCMVAGCYEELGDLDKAILYYERAFVRREWELNNWKSNDDARFLKSDCLSSLGRLYAKKGYKREAVICFEEAFSGSRFDYEPGETWTYFPLWCLCQHYLEENDFEKSIEQRKRLIHFFEEHQARYTKECAGEYFSLGNTYEKMKDYGAAIASYKQAISIYQQKNATMEEMVGCYENLWCAYAKAGNLDGFNEMNSFFQGFYLPNDEEKYYSSLWAASTLLSSEKVKTFLDALEENISKLNVWSQVETLERLSKISFGKKNAEATLIYCTKGIEVVENNELKDSAPGSLYFFYGMRSLANKELGQIKPAIDDVLNAMIQYDRCKGRTESGKIPYLSLLLKLYFDNGDYGKAVEIGSCLLPLIKGTYGKESRDYVDHARIEAVAMIHNKEYRKAIRFLKNLVDTVIQVDGRLSIAYATVLYNLGRAYMLNGDEKNAAEYLKQSKVVQLEVDGTVDSKTNKYLKELGYE